jgi:hypothetical protein
MWIVNGSVMSSPSIRITARAVNMIPAGGLVPAPPMRPMLRRDDGH